MSFENLILKRDALIDMFFIYLTMLLVLTPAMIRTLFARLKG
jgi:hypothetical protein|tara:strand:- start:482 stop:607 length:126 start_codon:yes stop_codon:yes gene_type:complete